jgi:hypothetical protein
MNALGKAASLGINLYLNGVATDDGKLLQLDLLEGAVIKLRGEDVV